MSLRIPYRAPHESLTHAWWAQELTAPHGAVCACATEQNLPADAGAALDGRSLVQDHVLPLDTAEALHTVRYRLVAGDEKEERSTLPEQ